MFSLLLVGVRAADVEVTTPADLGPGSLRQAIADVSAGGSISFAAGLAGATIMLGSELLVNQAMTIDASSLAVGITLSGGGVTRLIRVSAAGDLTLRGLRLTAGNGTGTANSGFGGALFNAGIATVERCTLSGNTAGNYGGSIFNALSATLTLTDSTFSGNSVSLYGGAISNSSLLNVSRCTFNDNASGFQGGGIYSDSFGNLSVTNSTFTGNSANFYGGAVFNGGPLTVASATLADNQATRVGGGIYSDYFGTIFLNSSIVSGNTSPESAQIFGNWAGSHNLTSGDSKLAPLGQWGGPTQTMPPLPGSPAIDAGGATSLTTDQRGLARVLGGGPDIGAFESAASSFGPNGLTIYAGVPVGDADGEFEISADPNFLPYVSTFAGTGDAGFQDATRLSAKFSYPSAVVQDALGNLFIADTGNHRIRMLAPNGTVSTIAGTGSYGMGVGNGTSAAFAFPSALALDPDGNVYVADTYNHRICKLTRPPTVGGSWTVTTLAGTGNAGLDEGSGSVARFNQPYGLTLDPSGNMFVADALNHRIRKITPSGTVSTFAGSNQGFLDASLALNAQFHTPRALVFSGGDLLVADTFNHRIRKIAVAGGIAGAVSTFAGSPVAGEPAESAAGFAEGPASTAKFNTPSGLAIDGSDSLYIADEQNHRIRKITAGEVTTVAGTGDAALQNGDSDVARFDSPTGVLVLADENLVVADDFNQVLRRIAIKPLTLPSALLAGSDDGSGGVQVSAFLDLAALGLDPETTYYFRWKSTTTGITQPLGQSFFLYDFPLVATLAATDLAPTTARLNATVDPKSGATNVVFSYSTDPDLLHPFEVGTLAASATAGLGEPSGVVADAAGNVYVADRLHHRIRKITPAGVVTTFVGSGVAGFLDGTGTAARFENPSGIAIDSAGNLYVADEFNHRIRKITPAGEVSSFAGSGIAGFADGAAGAARFLYPTGVAVDAVGHVYVADKGNHRIRRIAAADGAVTTLGGTGVAGFNNGVFATSQFSSPQALAVGLSGIVLVADTGNRRIRAIEAGIVSTLAGTGVTGFLDGPGSTALFASPQGIAMDGLGVAYVTDGANHRIRRIGTGGQVTTLAGSGVPGLLDSPAVGLYPATASQFDTPAAIAVDGAGGFFISQHDGLVRHLARSASLPSVTVMPDATGTGERLVFADVPQPLLPGARYYFQAAGTNYRGSASGEILSFVAPQAAISVFAGASTSAAAITHAQAEAVNFGSTPKGQPVTRMFTISNPGEWPLTVSAVDVPAGYQLAGGPGVIASLASSSFEITLPATSGGIFSGEVALTSDAPGQAVFSFPISGVVLDPPAVSTLAVSGTGTGTATLKATINPLGSATTVWFEWSLDPNFTGVLVSTTAGSDPGFLEGMGAAAKFNEPSGLVSDALGNIYVADTLNHRIRVISPDGQTGTYAGSGIAGFADGLASTAQFNEPVGLAMSSSGVLFVADSKNHRIRAIFPDGGVVTYSGLGTPGFTDGIPGAARFDTPRGLAIDALGVLYVADSENHRIRQIATDGSVATLSGTGTVGATNGAGMVAQFNGPLGIARDASGFVYVTETGSHAIRKIAPDGFTSVFAGSAASPGFTNAIGTAARFTSPAGLATGIGGTLFVADTGNHRIRAVSPAGNVTNYAGSGISGTADDSGAAAQFSSPSCVATTGSGAVIVGETGNSTIRKIVSAQVVLQAATGLSGSGDLAVELVVNGLPTDATYFFRAIATNGGGTTIGNTMASTAGGFLAWQIDKFGVNAGDPLIAGAAANPLGDGVSNLLKYALGLDPHAPTTNGLPVMETPGGSLTLTYTRMLAATDLLYQVEWSSDLDTWTTTGVSEEFLSGDAVSEQIRASVPVAPATSKFLRLKVAFQ